LFIQHRFDHVFFEFRCISLVRYSLRHKITPHLFFSIPYCLTNGEQFIFGGADFVCLPFFFPLFVEGIILLTKTPNSIMLNENVFGRIES
ncbi:MAG: hypothetical protein IKJ65_07580, partial [Clostridia bacterium]|nr:hypothetical protein [Clostridia bacterium]